MKLHQLLALLPSVKKQVTTAKTEIYHAVQKTDLFNGLSRVYQPREEEGYVYPSESKNVQLKVMDLIERFKQADQELIDLCAAQDFGNCNAKGNVVVDGVTILEDVPVSHLLFLEKQLEDIKTFIQKLPTLDRDKDWEYSHNRGYYNSVPPKETVKTKKITEFVIAAPATKEHPAQVKEVSKDTVEGTWSATDFSGALPADTVRAYLERVSKLHAAIIVAREAANGIDVEEKQIADKLFNYIFPVNIS